MTETKQSGAIPQRYIDAVKAAPELANEIAVRMTGTSGIAVPVHQVKAWLNSNPRRRTEPLLGKGTALLTACAELLDK